MGSRTKTFVKRCEQELLNAPQSAEDVLKLVTETGCTCPVGTKAPARKEIAAALVWLRSHKRDTAEMFDALPAMNQETLKKLYTAPLVPGRHWAESLSRMLSAFDGAASPVKQQAPRPPPPPANVIILPDDQRRPEEEVVIEKIADMVSKRSTAELAHEAIEEDQLVRLELERLAKKQKDRLQKSPASILAAAVAARVAAAAAHGGRLTLSAAGSAPSSGSIPWLSRAELVADLPPEVIQLIFLGRGWTRGEASKALKDEGLANSIFENSAQPQWVHRISFAMGSMYDCPDLNTVGKNLALITKLCLDGREQETSKMVTQVALQRWIEVQDMLAQPYQAAETNLQDSIDCIDGLVEKRAAMLTAMVVGCGEGGREVARGVERQTAEVRLLWPWIRAGLAKGALTSPTRTTANLLWRTLLGPAMDQRTGAAPSGATNLAAARSWLEARNSGAAGGQGGGAVRRKLAPALSQPVQQQAAPGAP